MAIIKNSAVRKDRRGAIQVTVHDLDSGAPVVNAAIKLYRVPEAAGGDADWRPAEANLEVTGYTGVDGELTFAGRAARDYVVLYDNIVPMGMDELYYQYVTVRNGCTETVCFEFEFGATVAFRVESNCQPADCLAPLVGSRVVAEMHLNGDDRLDESQLRFHAGAPWQPRSGEPNAFSAVIRRAGPLVFKGKALLARRSGPAGAAADDTPASIAMPGVIEGENPIPSPISGNLGVSLTRTETEATEDLPLWTLIRNSTEALSFTKYLQFMDQLFCKGGASSEVFDSLKKRRFLPFNDSDSYRVLKAATEAFVMVNCGVLNEPRAFDPEEDAAYLDRRDIPNGANLADVFAQDYLEDVDGTPTLPYLAVIRRKLPDIAIGMPRGKEQEAELCFGIIRDRLANPCLLELIWSYWHEEGMLVQSMNAITQRFQNLRAPGTGPDPLANTEIDMLRPLNNLLWGYTQDEQHRLTVPRRNYEYDHHYGVRLDGKAVQNFRPADSRSKFLEAFHHLLRLLTSFYKQDDDTTVKADAFPVLNALKEVHLILSQGAHNQFGDLPSTARIEMLMQQWLLARPEFREFLPTRVMVAYPEPWMDRVDAMKKLQGWSDTSVMHFRNLAMFGEQLLLSIRYGNWSDIYEATQAFNWARFWRPQVQGYIHAYRAATGVDLSHDKADPATDATLPSVLLRQRLAQQQRNVA